MSCFIMMLYSVNELGHVTYLDQSGHLKCTMVMWFTRVNKTDQKEAVQLDVLPFSQMRS